MTRVPRGRPKKERIRKDESVKKLFNKEISSKINISDADVSSFYNANRGSFNLPEPQVHMAQILVTPHVDTNVRNLKNDKAQDEDQAKKKIENMEKNKTKATMIAPLKRGNRK